MNAFHLWRGQLLLAADDPKDWTTQSHRSSSSTQRDITRTGMKSQEAQQTTIPDSHRKQAVREVVHDMQNSLFLISLHATMLREKGGGDWNILEKNIGGLRALIQNLGDAAALENDDLRLNPSRFDLAQTVRQAATAVHPHAAQRSIEVEIEVNPLPVVADMQRVERVLYNLLLNAIKFTPSGGHIHVSCVMDGNALVRVRDTGRGLSSHDITQLFEPLRQLCRPQENRDFGTGLGLFTAKGIVEAHGGQIGAISPGRGEGSTFWFRLPLAPDDWSSKLHP